MPLFHLGIYFQTMVVSYFSQLSVNNSDTALIQKLVKFLRTLNMQRAETERSTSRKRCVLVGLLENLNVV